MARKKVTHHDNGDVEIEQENIIVQLRKVVNLQGRKKVTLNDGDKIDVSEFAAERLLTKYDRLKTAPEKEHFVRTLVKSEPSFREQCAQF